MQRHTHADTYKIVLVGDVNVGKSCICIRFVKNMFNTLESNTIGASFFAKNMKVRGKEYKLNIWDTAGQERYHSLIHMYYRNSHGALVVFDVTEPKTFDRATKWVNEVRNHSADVVIILIGNKCDVRGDTRKVDFEKANAYAMKNNISYIETSAKENIGVSNCFSKLMGAIIDGEKEREREREREEKEREREKKGVNLKGGESGSSWWFC